MLCGFFTSSYHCSHVSELSARQDSKFAVLAYVFQRQILAGQMNRTSQVVPRQTVSSSIPPAPLPSATQTRTALVQSSAVDVA